MKTYITPTLLGLAIGILSVQPSFAQNDSDRRDRRSENSRTEERSDQRDGGERDRMDRRRDERRRSDSQTRRGRIEGEIVQTKKVDVRGTDRKHLVALLKTERGNRVAVDLGDVRKLGDDAPSKGDEVRIRGRLVKIGDRSVIVAEQFQGRGSPVVQVDRQDSRADRDRRQGDRGRMQRDRGRMQRDRGRMQRDRGRMQRDRGRETARRDAPGGLGVAMAPDREGNGVRVLQVMPGSPAAEAGLRAGDVITEVDDVEITDPRDLIGVIVQKRPGQQVRVLAMRDDRQRTFTAELVSRREALNARAEAERRRQEMRRRDSGDRDRQDSQDRDRQDSQDRDREDSQDRDRQDSQDRDRSGDRNQTED